LQCSIASHAALPAPDDLVCLGVDAALENNGKLTVLPDIAPMQRRLTKTLVASFAVFALSGVRPASALPTGELPASAPVVDPSLLCQAAVIMAESDKHTPVGLLRAVGTVESGRRDRVTGQLAPWPWTIDANGTGHMYHSEAEAIAAAQSFLQQGVTSLDIGCMQVNIQQHPHAFTSLVQAFDPMANVFYAADFLTRLKAQLGNWQQAIAAYHSQTPSIGAPYARQVLARWQGQTAGQPSGLPLVQTAMTPPLAPVAQSAAKPRVWGPGSAEASPAAKTPQHASKPEPGAVAIRSFAPGAFAFAPLHGSPTLLPATAQPGGPASRIAVPGGIAGGMAGRNLAAYRRAPIPIAGPPS
jgi:hypothetical protein